jgi:adenine/guanine phosphoribosyltransferase-like PRPP-binding protein
VSSWVGDRFDVRLEGDARLNELVRLALRRNPRRAHLLVSTVLGKHVPVDPRVVAAAGLDLGALVGGRIGARSALVIGFAETATGLGHFVAEALGSDYLHSTRRMVATAPVLAAFEEEHSHASGHRLLPEDPALIGRGEVAVLVDDELSTGRTALNTITALQAVTPRSHYVIAALVDLRSDADRRHLERYAADNGLRIHVVALAEGQVSAPADLTAAVARLAARRGVEAQARPAEGERPAAVLRPSAGAWPADIRESARHGFGPADATAARLAAKAVAAELVGRCGDRVLVLGTEELMYAPTLIGRELAELRPAVRLSSTTRSPVHVIDEPGYPVRDGLTFASHDPAADGPGRRFAYNVGGGFTDIVLVVDTDADTPELASGLLEQLRARCARVHVVSLPTYRPLPAPLRGPQFGSYRADEVAWLLTDLSEVPLEAPTEEREEAVQSGGAHYAESLPVEYQPDAQYRQLFDRALTESAARIAHAVGVVTEIVLAERGPAPVLASLARAGTPIGVLMRRWARFAHDRPLAHYALSIVRGRGIDEVALRYLAHRHDPADVVFIDGWTGKGAIARELAAAVAAVNADLGTAFSPDLAVLADPGSCVATFGTRDDFLVPSACLNSTVSGLVSRTVLNPAVLAPGQFHGAKFYRSLASDDVSARFLDAVTACFPAVAADVARDWPVAQVADRRPTWSGWQDVAALSERYGIGDITLVKPGVGETTRVLLRRIPWAVLVRPDAEAELAHVRLLAERRGVPVREVPGLAYSCVGLIHPRYTRGATGADGQAVRA